MAVPPEGESRKKGGAGGPPRGPATDMTAVILAVMPLASALAARVVPMAAVGAPAPVRRQGDSLPPYPGAHPRALERTCPAGHVRDDSLLLGSSPARRGGQRDEAAAT